MFDTYVPAGRDAQILDVEQAVVEGSSEVLLEHAVTLQVRPLLNGDRCRVLTGLELVEVRIDVAESAAVSVDRALPAPRLSSNRVAHPAVDARWRPIDRIILHHKANQR